MLLSEYVNDLITQKIPVGIVRKLYIYDKDGRRIDFSDKLEINGVNRLIDFGTVETVIEKEINHFYNKTGDITVRNNDRFFNMPFPATLKDENGDAAIFLKDASGIINVFRKPGSVSAYNVNGRYTLVEVVAEIEIFGKIVIKKLATLLLSKIVTDTKDTAVIKTDGLIEAANSVSAEKVVDGVKNWFAQRPVSFLIRELLKKAYGVYDDNPASTFYRQLVLPRGFVIPSFLDLVINFNSSLYGAFGRPPVQIDTDGDGEPDTFPSTSKQCRAVEYEPATGMLYLGIDDELWVFDTATWIFSSLHTFGTPLRIEDLAIIPITGRRILRLRTTSNLHEVLDSADKSDDFLKVRNTWIAYYDLATNTVIYSEGFSEYDSEFNYISGMSTFLSTVEYAAGANYQDPISVAYSFGNSPLQNGKLVDILGADPILTEWAAIEDTDGANFVDLTKLRTTTMYAFDDSGLYYTTPGNTKYFDFTAVGSLRNLNIPIPFTQTIYVSSPGEVSTQVNKISHTVAIMKSKTLTGEIVGTNDYTSYGTNVVKKPDFIMSKGYYAIYAQVYSVDYGNRYNLPNGQENEFFANVPNDYRGCKDVKFSLGQKGANSFIYDSTNVYETFSDCSPVKIGIKYVKNHVKADSPYLVVISNKIWKVNARTNIAAFSDFAYTYPGFKIKQVDITDGTSFDLLDIRLLTYKGRDAQPLCVIPDIDLHCVYVPCVVFHTVDSRFVYDFTSPGYFPDKETAQLKSCELVVFRIPIDSNGIGSFTLTSDAKNVKDPGNLVGDYHKIFNGFYSSDATSDNENSSLNCLVQVTSSAGNEYTVHSRGTAPSSSSIRLDPTGVVSESGGPWESSSLGLDLTLDVDDGEDTNTSDYIYADVDIASPATIRFALQTAPVDVYISSTLRVVAKVSLIPVDATFTITLRDASDTVIATYSDLMSVWNTLTADWTYVDIPMLGLPTTALTVECYVTSLSTQVVSIAHIKLIGIPAQAGAIAYYDEGLRLHPDLDAPSPQYNILPSGDFRNTTAKIVAGIDAVYTDVAFLDGVVYGTGGSKKVYLSVLLLKNILDAGVDTTYTDSPNQYAIWQMAINPTTHAWTRTCIKTLFNQPKSLTIKDEMLFFSLEGLGAIASIDLATNEYKGYDLINPAVYDEMYTNSKIAVKTAAANPVAYSISSPANRDRYNFKLTAGKYYFWQLSPQYPPIIEYSDFSGMSCEDVLQQFCQMLNWIKGFDENGNFFMVPRNPVYTTPDLVLTEDINCKYVDITGMENTVDEIINQCSVTPYRTNLQAIKFNLTYRKRTADDIYPNLNLDAEQRDLFKKTLDLLCIRDGEVALVNEDLNLCPLFKWRITESETEIGIAITTGGDNSVLYLNSVFGGELSEGGIKPRDLLKFSNAATDEYEFREVSTVSPDENKVVLTSGFTFMLTKGMTGYVVKPKNVYYSDERVAVCIATPTAGTTMFQVDTLDNIGIGTVLENPDGIRTIVRDKITNSDGTLYVRVDTTDFCENADILKGYWAPLVSNVLYEIGGSSVFVKLSIKDSNDAIKPELRSFYVGDYLQMVCEGLKLEQDDTSKQTYIDAVSAAMYGLVTSEISNMKFLTRPLARNLAKLQVLENAAPRFKGVVQSVFLPQLSPVWKAGEDYNTGRLYVIQVQNSKLFPLLQGNSVDFYLTSIKHNLAKRTTEFSVRGIKPIGQ